MNFQYIPREKIVIEGYRLRFQSGLEDIDDLVNSIDKNGLLCPLIVRTSGRRYILLAGFRRLKALDKLGWEKIPCAIMDVAGNREALIKGIVENIERLDLSPLERAKGFAELIENYGSTQLEIADKTSRSQGYVSQHTRLLKALHPEVLKYLHDGKITFGHARALMRLSDQEKQLEIANQIIADQLNVKETELVVDLARPEKELTDREKELNAIERDVMNKLTKEWRKRVIIRQGKKREKILINFSDRSELKEMLLRIAASL